MQGMTPDFQKRQMPVASLIIAVSVAATGLLVTLVSRAMGSKAPTSTSAPSREAAPVASPPSAS
ncbi:hypothetical protein [Acetobacter sp.]|jgi:hypothetical protein|uniref:hypothetical protein n=1 Tax=Acetobacter sp. TaxID=440 RepID=UPI0025C3040F|nr:hypothetical protein [Acetobacter sp.]MCH4090891.1 hypothetical protein [Acetobacter sp.]MCI1301025.1 hypothetical protein [Acetobacter sp.]MCI1317349.1 hypothetical protein [Acetobacter sp.]